MALENLIQRVRAWLPAAQSQLQANVAELEAQLSESDFTSLSPATFADLKTRLETLRSPISYRQTLQTELKEALDQWLKPGTKSNSLVVQCHPVEPIERILREAIVTWIPEYPVSIEVLQESNQRLECSSIQPRLQEQLGSLQTSSFSQKEKDLIIVIPNLSQLFLRCLDGFDAIEYLKDQAFQNPSIFWLIGCNEWLWRYLNRVCDLSAYFGDPISLPFLGGFELKEWLDPVCESINFEFTQQNQQKAQKKFQNNHSSDTNQPRWASELEQKYFDSLANVASGIGQSAARLWLYSLHILQSDENGDDDVDESSQPTKLVTLKAKLPDLPDLTQDQRFLLYSLGLHERMGLSELSISLGDSISQVRNQIQVLLKADVVERNHNLLQVNPAHYSQLQQDLANNYFLVGDSK